ncbi:MAG: glycoside hydrolase family 38 C-terminal domain-containing protein [Vampirovibrionales bacterium]
MNAPNPDASPAQSVQPTLHAPLFAYFHTHWDREWYLPFRTYQHRLAQVGYKLVEALEAEVIPCFAFDGQTILVDDLLELRPHLTVSLQRLIQQGTLSVGPWYVMPDEFLVSGESLLRNLTLGIARAKALGQHSFTGYIPDTFGHSADMPLIFQLCGIKTAMLWRGINPAKPGGIGSAWFWWASASGDRVLTYHLTTGYFQNVFHMAGSDTEKTDWFRAWLAAVAQVSPDGLPVLYPVGADHLGFDAGTVTDLDHALAQAHMPLAGITTPDRFMTMQRLGQDYAEAVEHLPEVRGELVDCSGQYLLKGTFSSRMQLKQANRHLEWRLVHRLEPKLAWVALLGLGFAEAASLDTCWRLLLKNHPHDSICGCSVDAVHLQNEDRFRQVGQLAEALEHSVIDQLKTHLGIEEGLMLFNHSDEPYTGVVEVQGHFPFHRDQDEADLADPPLPEAAQLLSRCVGLDETYLTNYSCLPLSEHQAIHRSSLVWVSQLPAQGLTTLEAVAPTPDPVTVGDGLLENGQLRVEVANDGTLTVTDKQTGQVYENQCRFTLRPEQGDSYNAAPVPLQPAQSPKLKAVEVAEAGPLRGALSLTLGFKNAEPLTLLVRLAAGSRRVAFYVRQLNTQPFQCLQASFAFLEPVDRVVAQGHFTPVERRYDPNYDIIKQMPAPRLTELPTNTGPIQQFIQIQGITLFTQGLAEYECRGRRWP